MASCRNAFPSEDGAMHMKLEELSKGWPRVLNYPLHPNHQLAKTLRSRYSCDGCGKLGEDWSFHCAACDFDLHPECALEGELLEMAKSWPKQIQHKLHREHALVKTRCESYFCDACAEKGSWWSFYCTECDFGLHPDCALPTRAEKAELPERVVHEIVWTASRGSYWCSRCAEEGRGCSYHCEDCNIDVHPKCANMGGTWPEQTVHELHGEHQLAKRNWSSYTCDKCWAEGRGWSFCCEDCDFHLHPKCAVQVPGRDRVGGGGWLENVMHERQKQQPPTSDVAENQTELQSAMDRLEQVRLEAELAARGRRAALDLIDEYYERGNSYI